MRRLRVSMAGPEVEGGVDLACLYRQPTTRQATCNTRPMTPNTRQSKAQTKSPVLTARSAGHRLLRHDTAYCNLTRFCILLIQLSNHVLFGASSNSFANAV
jgi:hypothetical protein